MVQGRIADYFLQKDMEEVWINTFNFFKERRYFTIENPSELEGGRRYMELVRKPTFSTYGYKIYVTLSPSSEGTTVHAEVKLNYGWGSYAHLKPNKDLKEWAIFMGIEPVNIAKGAYACCVVLIVVVVIVIFLPFMLFYS